MGYVPPPPPLSVGRGFRVSCEYCGRFQTDTGNCVSCGAPLNVPTWARTAVFWSAPPTNYRQVAQLSETVDRVPNSFLFAVIVAVSWAIAWLSGFWQ